jgi:tetratricopeptide (TPR) repeat protein
MNGRKYILGLLVICCILFNVSYKSNYLKSGVVAFNKGDFSKAVNYFEKELKNDPTAAIVHYNLGMAYFKMKQYSAAKAALSAAGYLDSRLASMTRFYLGLCHYQEKEYELALQELGWVVKNFPQTKLADAAREIIDMI